MEYGALAHWCDRQTKTEVEDKLSICAKAGNAPAISDNAISPDVYFFIIFPL